MKSNFSSHHYGLIKWLVSCLSYQLFKNIYPCIPISTYWPRTADINIGESELRWTDILGMFSFHWHVNKSLKHMWTMLQDNGGINKTRSSGLGLNKLPLILRSRDFWPKVEDNSLDAANE